MTDLTEKIELLITTIQNINQITVNRYESERNRIIKIEEAEDYEDWETTEVKEKLYTQLGKLYFQEKNNN